MYSIDYQEFSLHFTINGFLSCPQLRAAMNEAAKDILVQFFPFTSASISLGFAPRWESVSVVCVHTAALIPRWSGPRFHSCALTSWAVLSSHYCGLYNSYSFIRSYLSPCRSRPSVSKAAECLCKVLSLAPSHMHWFLRSTRSSLFPRIN